MTFWGELHIHSVRDIGTQGWTIEEAREGHLVTLAKFYGTMEFNDVMSSHTSQEGQLAKPKVMWLMEGAWIGSY